MTIQKIVIAGVLSSIAILLGITRLGFIPVPTPAGTITIMHIPAIIGGILQGWGVGAVIGFIFGLSSFLGSTIPIFKDPLVSILPRLFIGITAYFTYVGLRKIHPYFAIAMAGLVGSFTNTLLVLGMVILRGYLAPGVAITLIITNGLAEAIASVIITLAIISSVKKMGYLYRKKSKIS